MDNENLNFDTEEAKSPKRFKWLKVFLGIAVFVLLGFIIAAILYWQVTKFPEPANPVVKKYQWQYQSKNFSLDETLYGNIFEYYSKQQKGILGGFENVSLAKYLKLPQEDRLISDLTDKIEQLAKDNALTQDQEVDFVAAFVQSLQYDEARAKTDLTHPRYPYETLYELKGICSDKTLLTVAILRELGFGAAVFLYENEQHMAAAVQCPQEYSNYASGYCIVETTAEGHKIGVIPEIDQSSLRAVDREEIRSLGTDGTAADTNKKLTNPDIYSKTEGLVYQGVIQTIKIEKEITSLLEYLDKQKQLIESKEASLATTKTQMDAYYAAQNYRAYNQLVIPYNKGVNELDGLIDEYNSKVSRYNELIKL